MSFIAYLCHSFCCLSNYLSTYFSTMGSRVLLLLLTWAWCLRCVPSLALLGLTGFWEWHGAGQVSLPTGSGGMVGAGCPSSASISVRCKWYGQGTGDVRSPLVSSQSEKEKMASASFSASNAEGAHTNGICQRSVSGEWSRRFLTLWQTLC